MLPSDRAIPSMRVIPQEKADGVVVLQPPQSAAPFTMPWLFAASSWPTSSRCPPLPSPTSPRHSPPLSAVFASHDIECVAAAAAPQISTMPRTPSQHRHSTCHCHTRCHAPPAVISSSQVTTPPRIKPLPSIPPARTNSRAFMPPGCFQ